MKLLLSWHAVVILCGQNYGHLVKDFPAGISFGRSVSLLILASLTKRHGTFSIFLLPFCDISDVCVTMNAFALMPVRFNLHWKLVESE
jgi:hypothetical protein